MLGAERAEPGEVSKHPRLTRFLGHVATCSKRHSKERQKITTKLLGTFFRSEEMFLQCKNISCVITFASVKARHSFCQHRVSLVDTRRINYNLIFKVILKIWPQVKVMTWSEKVMLHISRIVSSAWTHQRCFHRSSWPLIKVIAEKLLITFHDLNWPWWHDEGSQYSDSGCQFYL